MQDTPTPSSQQPPILQPYQDFEAYLSANEAVVPDLTDLRSAVDKITASGNTKVLAKAEFVKRSHYYIVPLDGKFYYYPLTLGFENGLFRFQNHVKTVLEGFVVVEREVYYVTASDLRKRVARPSRKVVLYGSNLTYENFLNGSVFRNPRANSSSTGATAPDDTPEASGSTQASEGTSQDRVIDQATVPRVRNHRTVDGRDSVDEEQKLADLAFEEQVYALHDFEDQEEEWLTENDS